MAPEQTLVFCFDGTGNEPSDAGEFKEDESISNVLKLHLLLGGGLTDGHPPVPTVSGRQQRSFYYNGIGTLEAGRRIPLLGWLYNAGRAAVNMALAPTFGDARRILDDALKDFDDNYDSGDKVVIFGYSRGAALARKFASLLLKKDHKGQTKADAVAFLGVFDTVAAMNGIHRKGDRTSSDVVFENGTLDEKIGQAVHLLALDEDRVPFTPTLMNKDKDPDQNSQNKGADKNNKNKDPNKRRILEVWFPGVHGDVGGGYWLDGLSDVALEFMIDLCKKELGEGIKFITEEKLDCLLGEQDKQDNALAGLVVDDIAIHPLIHGPLHTHGGVTAAVMERDVRSVHVSDHDRPSKNDLPLVHESVKERFGKVADYRPPALRGLDFHLVELDKTCTLKRSGPWHGIADLR